MVAVLPQQSEAPGAAYGTFQAQAGTPSPRRLSAFPRATVGALLLLCLSTIAIVAHLSPAEDALLQVANPVGALTHPNAGADSESLKDFVASLPEEMRELINPEADPCSDFHTFACGKWEKKTHIKNDRTSASWSWDMDSDNLVKDLHEDFKTDPGKAGRFWRACHDVSFVESLGHKPLLPWLNLVDTVQDPASLSDVMAKLHLAEVDSFFEFWVGSDHADPTKNNLYLSSSGLNLPDKTYYTSDSPEHKQHRAAYSRFLVDTMQAVGWTKAKAKTLVNDTMLVETLLASNLHKADDLYKHMDLPPKYDLNGLSKLYPQFDWKTYFNSLNQTSIDSLGAIFSPTRKQWFQVAMEFISEQRYDVIRNYMKAHVVYNLTPMLSSKFLNINLDFDKVLYGTSEPPPRWRKCVNAAKHSLPMLVGKMFVEKHVTKESKAAATRMLEDVKESFKRDLDTVEWMTPATRGKAKAKLDRIFIEVAYPDTWPDADFLVTEKTYLENTMRASTWRELNGLKDLYKPVNRREWSECPAEVNAFYSNGVNGVFIPGGILQNPFFDINFPLPRNYGSIGAIMGHELTHGFDNTGRKYDAEGRRHDWWDAPTVGQFRQRSQCVAKLFDSFKIAGVHVNGNQTLGESIADLGGLKIAYKALQTHDSSHYSRRLFWTSFAQSWCGKQRDRDIRMQILTDAHPPDKFRIIAPLSQLDAFATDFQCPVGSRMNPKDKCVLW